jgi:hypothetical protein
MPGRPARGPPDGTSLAAGMLWTDSLRLAPGLRAADSLHLADRTAPGRGRCAQRPSSP